MDEILRRAALKSSAQSMGMRPEEINKNDASVTIVTGSQGCGNYFCRAKTSLGAPTAREMIFLNDHNVLPEAFIKNKERTFA
jgi:hypothetical protein